MAPVVHGLERDYAGKIGFVYLDIDDPTVAPLKQELGYRVQPHLLLLDYEGNVVKQWVGLPSENNLTAAFDPLLAGKPIP
jgi:hypothetical protein|tara:strand:+ start:785 stop:1024 length:240 start_codon:yes stop_codon:yes gene_type:complete